MDPIGASEGANLCVVVLFSLCIRRCVHDEGARVEEDIFDVVVSNVPFSVTRFSFCTLSTIHQLFMCRLRGW